MNKFAEKLPDGWNANIGENDCELSSGERQRISIARAFLKDAPIILLDEATASLDVENETAIQEALSRLIWNKTVLIIAHRMRTVSGADQIVVLKDGTVAEQDSPVELLQLGGIFARMVSSCPIVIFQCRDNRNDSDLSPFVCFAYHTTILEIKRRNPNPSPIGMMFGFLWFGGAT